MATIKSKKGAGADLLLEIILSSIVFFVVTILLFGMQIPKQQFHANAVVISADASVACELSLTNLMRANSSTGINYNDWLINEYAQGNDLSSWKNEVEAIFNNAFKSGRWDMNITMPNGTTILSFGSITENTGEIFPCRYYVPYSAAYSKYFCFPKIPEIKGLTNGKPAAFKTPDGDVNCKISISESTLGVQYNPSDANCNLDLTAKVDFEEDLSYSMINSPDFNDTIILPLIVNGAHYEITVRENTLNSNYAADVSLVKSSLLEDCALNVILQSTNVSSQF